MLPTLNRVLSYIVFVRTPRSTALTEQEIHCQTESPGVAVATFVKELPRYLQKTLDVTKPVSYTHLRAHETKANLVCRLLLEKKKKHKKKQQQTPRTCKQPKNETEQENKD